MAGTEAQPKVLQRTGIPTRVSLFYFVSHSCVGSALNLRLLVGIIAYNCPILVHELPE
jgi:hypothetical protein